MKWTGILFILPLLVYGTGNGIVENVLKDSTVSPDENLSFLTGICLMLANSVIVILLGVFIYREFRNRSGRLSKIYLSVRIMEALLLAVSVLLIAFYRDNSHGETRFLLYHSAMTILGAGSLVLMKMLKENGYPKFFVVWGTAGYSLLAAGSIGELAGFSVGVLLSIPGGLFELTFGIWLCVKRTVSATGW